MWLLIAREPLPDKPYWPGRRWLAAVDAVGWPLLWIVVVRNAPAPLGIVGPVLVGATICCAVARLHRALCVNHRYRFTAWRWGRWFAALLVLGVILKLALAG